MFHWSTILPAIGKLEDPSIAPLSKDIKDDLLPSMKFFTQSQENVCFLVPEVAPTSSSFWIRHSERFTALRMTLTCGVFKVVSSVEFNVSRFKRIRSETEFLRWSKNKHQVSNTKSVIRDLLETINFRLVHHYGTLNVKLLLSINNVIFLFTLFIWLYKITNNTAVAILLC